MTADSFIADFADMMPSVVKVAPRLNSDQYGAATYGTDVPYKAHVSNKAGYIRGPQGELIATKGRIWLNCQTPFPPTSRVTLPDGTTPPILAVNGAEDETGEQQFTRVDFG